MDGRSCQHHEGDGDDRMHHKREPMPGGRIRALDRPLDQGTVLVTFADYFWHGGEFRYRNGDRRILCMAICAWNVAQRLRQSGKDTTPTRRNKPNTIPLDYNDKIFVINTPALGTERLFGVPNGCFSSFFVSRVRCTRSIEPNSVVTFGGIGARFILRQRLRVDHRRQRIRRRKRCRSQEAH